MAFQPGTDTLYAVVGRQSDQTLYCRSCDGCFQFRDFAQSRVFLARVPSQRQPAGRWQRRRAVHDRSGHRQRNPDRITCGLMCCSVWRAYPNLPSDTQDWYSFTLSDGQTATLAAEGAGSGLQSGTGRQQRHRARHRRERGESRPGDQQLHGRQRRALTMPASRAVPARVTTAWSSPATRISTPRTTTIRSSAQSLDPAGAVLGHVSSIGKLLGADDGDTNLLLVDPNTGTSTIIASNVGGGRGYNDLALNPVTGVLYGSQSLNSWGLYTIDTASFAETYIGDLGGNVRALAWSPDGATLYGFRNSAVRHDRSRHRRIHGDQRSEHRFRGRNGVPARHRNAVRRDQYSRHSGALHARSHHRHRQLHR